MNIIGALSASILLAAAGTASEGWRFVDTGSSNDGTVSAYYVDEGLAAKFGSIFEVPAESEINVWIKE